VTVLELAAEVAKVADVARQPLVPGLYRVGDTRHIRSDVSALESLGWSVQEPLADTVREYVTWAVAEPGFRNEAAAAHERNARARRAPVGSRGREFRGHSPRTTAGAAAGESRRMRGTALRSCWCTTGSAE
jgi:hypothetical protein